MLFAIRFHDHPGRIEVRRQQLQAHIAWLDVHKDVILVGGSLRQSPEEDPVGGLWIVEAASKETVEELIAQDPFSIHGLRERHEIFHWSKAFPGRRVPV
jgi:uncharacterized protein